jgi:hypothetical protein
MYSWGNDTSDWRGSKKYKFDSARAPYLDDLAKSSKKNGPRTYEHADAPGKLVDPRGKTISSDSKNPIVVGVDVTGSMSTWPGEIFDRLPLVYQTLSQYRPDVELSFSAIGDANSDKYPLQVNHFGKGIDLESHIKALYPEGGGGGQGMETYELFGYFMNTHCKTPNAHSPFLFIFGDEGFYDQVEKSQVKHYIGDTLEKDVSSTQLLKKLTQSFDLYLLHKTYDGGDSQVVKQWSDAIGSERVVRLPSKERAVDVLIGIVAKKWGQFGDFQENLGARQESASAQQSVYNSIRSVPDGGATNSVMRDSDGTLSGLYKNAKR